MVGRASKHEWGLERKFSLPIQERKEGSDATQPRMQDSSNNSTETELCEGAARTRSNWWESSWNKPQPDDLQSEGKWRLWFERNKAILRPMSKDGHTALTASWESTRKDRNGRKTQSGEVHGLKFTSSLAEQITNFFFIPSLAVWTWEEENKIKIKASQVYPQLFS